MTNFWTRLLSGTLFVAIMVAGMLLCQEGYAVLMLFIMVTMMAEFYSMTMGERHRFSRLIAILVGVTMFVTSFHVVAYEAPVRLISIGLLPLMLLIVNSLYTKEKTEMWEFSVIYTGIFYIALPVALTIPLVYLPGGFDGSILLCLFVMIWSSDIGAYLFGCGLGKRFPKKLFPEISPKKTIVGAAGGAVCTVFVAVMMKLLGAFPLPWIHTLVLALVVDVCGVYGDLFESQWKRYCGVKDSGKIIPGHGGMLDRFDSSLTAIPGALLYLSLTGLLT